MNRIFFEKREENSGHRGIVKCNDSVRNLSECEMIEIMVSLLRARFEIEYLKESKNNVFKSAEIIPIVILEKNSYGLKVVLSKEKIQLQLFDFKCIQYTFETFALQCEAIYEMLNRNYGQGDFDFRIFSPTYLEHMLGVDIPRIKKVEYSRQRISSLFFYDRKGPRKVRITEHDLFKQLQSGLIEPGNKITNHIFESNIERIRNILTEVKKQPEAYAAVVYGDEDVVRDGTHRLACLYYLYGDIEIPIIKVFVSKPYYSYTMYRAAMNNIEMDVIK